jgi:hypothetical protein
MPFGDLHNPNLYLYHYTSAATALGNILPTRFIRFGLAKYVNDPREFKEWSFRARGGTATPDIAGINTRAIEQLQRTAKLLCLARDDPVRSRPGSGVELFGRGFARPAMWAHYAGHSGVCLIFDRGKLRDQIMNKRRVHTDWRSYAGNVTYEDYAPDEIDAFSINCDRVEAVGLDAALEEHWNAQHAVLFFRKNEDWADEFEYRWLLRTPHPAPVFVPIGDSLAGIVVGEYFRADDRDSLEHLAAGLGSPPIATCTWGNGAPDTHLWGMSGISLGGFRAWTKGAKRPPPPPDLELH